MSERRQRLYRRLDRAERAAIERGPDKGRSARAMARDPGRSQSSVADEVGRNRTVSRGPGRGSRVESVPGGACARLRGWPHARNGCNKRRYHCSMPFRCEHSAARAQLLADGELSAARRGIYLTVVNILTFVSLVWDKHVAKRGNDFQKRLPEGRLLALCLAGGPQAD